MPNNNQWLTDNSEKELFGVKIVPLNSVPKDEALFVSGAKMTHAENLTTAEKTKIVEFIDSVKVEALHQASLNKEGDK